MKAPRKSTAEYVYAKLKTEVISFIKREISLNDEMEGELYSFNAEEQMLYDRFCNAMILWIENTEPNYSAIVDFYKDEEEIPF